MNTHRKIVYNKHMSIISNSLEKVIFEMILESRWNLPDLDDYDGDSFEEYYDKPIEKERLEMEEKQGNLYYGRNVVWIGENGKMIKIPASEVTPREDNIFDFAKVKAVKEHIENSEERIYFDAPLAQVVVVDFGTIKEMQQTYHNGRFGIDYNISEPFSLGDEDLDLFLGNPEAWQEENGLHSYDDVLLFMKEPKKWLEEWSYSEDPSEWTEDEKEDYESMLEDIENLKKVKKEIEQAIEDGDGDIGEYWVDLRDGNHRAFGAIASGEPYIWAIALNDRTDASVELQ